MNKFKKTVTSNSFVLIFLLAFFFLALYQTGPLLIEKFYEETSWISAKLSKKKLETKNFTFTYVERGEGPVLLFIHGFRSSKSYWNGYIKKLPKKYHCIALDLPGHGETTNKNKMSYDLESVSLAIDEFLKGKKIDKLNLVGTSLGSAYLMEYASAHRSQVEKIVLINPVAIRPKTEKSVQEMLEKNKQLFTPKTMDQLDFLKLYLSGAKFNYPKYLKKYFLEKMKKENVLSKQILEDISSSSGVEKYLPLFNMPILILQGDRDLIVNKSDKKIYKKKLASVKYVMISPGYHVFNQLAFKRAVFEMKRFLLK